MSNEPLIVINRLCTQTGAIDEFIGAQLNYVFDLGYGAIASALDRSEAACRQVVHRARQRVRGDRKRFEATDAAKKALLEQFLVAMEARDESAIAALFAPDAAWTVDGGGRGAAARVPIVGAGPVARHVVFLREKVWGEHRRLEIATVNGETGLCIRDGGRLTAVITIATDGQRILNVYAVVNPDKLS